MLNILVPLKNQFDRVYGLLAGAIENCPDELWKSKTGGFYYWQQLYHTFAIIDNVFLDGQTPDESLYPAEVAALTKHISEAPDKAVILKMARAKMAATDAFFEKTTEAELWQKHEGRSKRFGRDVNLFESLVLLVGHGYYHVGVCDVALRDMGLKGMM